MMRVLIVADDAEWRSAAAASLNNSEVESYGCSLADCQSVVTKSQPDALVFRWPEEGGVSALEAACAADKTGSLYVLAVVGDEALRVVKRAFAAGAHDIVHDRYFSEEARLRIDARSRLWRWMRAISATGDAPNTLATLRAWRHLGDIVTDELEAMLGCPLDIAECSQQTTSMQSATIVLSFAAERFELCVRVGGDDAALDKLGELLVGDAHASAAARTDFLREMANIAGGAVKRSALPEHVTLTMGLATDGKSGTPSSGQRAWALTGDGLALWLTADLRARENERVPATRLREGMVVVKDVRGATGMLLVAGGTRLTMTTAVRLGVMLGERTLVEVADAA